MSENRVLVVLVAGYVRKEVFEVAHEMISKEATMDECRDDQFGYHVYPWNSEGYQLHVISSVPLENPIDATFAFFNSDADIPDMPSIRTEYHPEVPEVFTGPNYGGTYHAVGMIHGYSDEGDERYEC